MCVFISEEIKERWQRRKNLRAKELTATAQQQKSQKLNNRNSRKFVAPWCRLNNYICAIVGVSFLASVSNS